MQPPTISKNMLCKFEEFLCEIDPGYKNAGYAYFLTLNTETCEKNIEEIIERSESLGLGDVLGICEPEECYLGIKPTYSLEIKVTTSNYLPNPQIPPR